MLKTGRGVGWWCYDVLVVMCCVDMSNFNILTAQSYEWAAFAVSFRVSHAQTHTCVLKTSVGWQDLVTQFLVKITFLYKLVAKKLHVLSKLQISIWKERATVAVAW